MNKVILTKDYDYIIYYINNPNKVYDKEIRLSKNDKDYINYIMAEFEYLQKVLKEKYDEA